MLHMSDHMSVLELSRGQHVTLFGYNCRSSWGFCLPFHQISVRRQNERDEGWSDLLRPPRSDDKTFRFPLDPSLIFLVFSTSCSFWDMSLFTCFLGSNSWSFSSRCLEIYPSLVFLDRSLVSPSKSSEQCAEGRRSFERPDCTSSLIGW